MKMVNVVAIGIGFDGVKVRQPGEEFQLPASVFDKRPRLDKDGKETGQFYDQPSWVKIKDVKAVPTESKEEVDLV